MNSDAPTDPDHEGLSRSPEKESPPTSTDRSADHQIHDENEVTGEQLIDYFGGRVPDMAFTFLRAEGGYQQHQKRAMMVYMGLVYQEGKHCGKSEVQSDIDFLRDKLERLERLEESRQSDLFRWQMDAARNGNITMLLHLGEVLLGQKSKQNFPEINGSKR